MFNKKIDRCKNKPESSLTIKVEKNISSGFSMSSISLFKNIENKYDVYRAEDYMRKFYESLRQLAVKIINFEKKTMELLTNE